MRVSISKSPSARANPAAVPGEALAEGILILTGFRNPVVTGQKLSLLIYDDVIRRMFGERTAEGVQTDAHSYL